MKHAHNIAFDAASARTTDANGFLHVAMSNISKEAVNPYYGREIPGWEKEGLDPNKIYQGYRPGDELAKAASTFNGLPILLDHKVDSAADPQKLLRVGSMGTDAVYEAPYLKNSLAFTDAQAIEAIEAEQKVELSSAYRYTPVFEPGTFDGQPYDFRMTNIQGNHLALVDEGRAGADVVVADQQLKPNGETHMSKFKQVLRAGAAKLRALAMDEALDPEKIEDALEVVRAEVQKAEGDPNPAKPEGQDEDPKAKLAAMINALKIDDAEKQALLAAVEGLGMDEEEQKPDPDAKPAQDEDKGVPEDDKKSSTPAMDAALMRKSVLGDIQATLKAKEDCEALCGKLVVNLATDSSEDIYGKALALRGVDIKGHPKSAYRSMVQMLAAQPKASPTVAQDARTVPGDMKGTPFAGLAGIKIG